MSASHRRIARLPLSVFDNLITRPHDHVDPEALRSAMCSKLKKFPVKSRNGSSMSFTSVKTVGALLQTPKKTLLQVLDPLLTFGT
jgi:hypothetical protein